MRIWVINGRRLLVFLGAGFVLFFFVAVPMLRQESWRVVSSLLAGKIIPIYSVETTDKKVAFSFDAVWGADQTQELLAILRKNKVKTTFFLGGFWLEKYPEMVKLIAEEGHEIGNHTYTHPHLNSLSTERIAEELNKTHQLIVELTGQKPFLFRPPFGEYSNKVIETAKTCGYVTIIWDVDSLDWRNLSSAEMTQRVYSRVKPGSIVLFHNAGKHTPAAIDALLSNLTKDGYRIIPISQILLQGETYVDHTGRQRLRSTPPVGDVVPSQTERRRDLSCKLSSSPVTR